MQFWPVPSLDGLDTKFVKTDFHDKKTDPLNDGY